MTLYWSEDYLGWAMNGSSGPHIRYALREQMPKHQLLSVHHDYTHAWVTKIKDGKWDCQLFNTNGSRTFRTCKQAKAYAVAIITLSK